MTRRTIAELKQFVSSVGGDASLYRRGYALSVLARNCLLPRDYVYPEVLDSAIVLTPEGEEIRQTAMKRNPGFSRVDVKAALLAILTHDELLVDLQRSNFDAVTNALSIEIRERRIQYPFVFHTELYDAYFDRFGADHVKPSAEDSLALVASTSQGVFQVSDLAVGPFGILQCPEERRLFPTMSAPLAHCRDTTCPGIHTVVLRTSSTSASRVYGTLSTLLLEMRGDPAPFAELFMDMLWPDETMYADVNPSNLFWLLGNTLAESELRALLARTIELGGKEIRDRLAPLKSLERSSAADAMAGLDRAHTLHGLMAASSADLVSALDELVYSGAIIVPATEVRAAPYSGPLSATPGQAELSKFGVRFDRQGFGTLRLRELVRQTHTSDDLAWALVDFEGSTTEEKLENAIHQPDVRSLVSTVLLGSRQTYQATLDYLEFGYFPEPSNAVEREYALSRILWKLGFDVIDLPELPVTLRHAISQLRDALPEKIIDESAISTVRSVAVNLVVPLEDFLDEALSFACFALLNDHYGGSRWKRFSYTAGAARECMQQWIAGGSRSSGEALQFDSSGKNNLFALVHGFRELARLLSEIQACPEDRERQLDEYPKWWPHSGVHRFPFRHTIPFLDLSPESQSDLIDRLERVTQVLLSGDAMGVRNRIPHGGREFPSVSAFQVALAAIDEAQQLLETGGLSANVSQFAGSEHDAMGREAVFLTDYMGRKATVRSPSDVRRCGLPASSDPQIIVSKARLRDSAEVLRLKFDVESEFSRMWADYPRQRVEGSLVPVTENSSLVNDAAGD